MKAKWIIDKHITRNTSYENLSEIISNLGYEVTEMEYVPFLNADEYKLPYNVNECVITYCTLNLLRKLPPYFGTFANQSSLRYHRYISNLDVDNRLFLNSDFVMTTYKDFKTNFSKFEKLFNTDALFIRPDSGFKLFTGMPIYGHNYKAELNSLDQLSSAVNDTLIIVAKAKRIYSEARFIIAGDSVIDGSRYKVHGVHSEDRNVSEDMRKLAEIVAKAEYKPEEVFTCDIADTPDGVKIIELNSFSGAGLYACDLNKVIPEVSKYVEQLYKNQNED